MKGFHPSATEVYCIRCPSCGQEWALRWPPPVGQRGGADVSEKWRDLPWHARALIRVVEAMLRVSGWATVPGCAVAADLLQAQREDDARDDGAPGPEQVPGPPRPPR